MSEPKLCPFRKWADKERLPDHYDLFGPCLEDKCAMWRGYDSDQFVADGNTWATPIKIFGCGLAGRP